ncbi:hypothetical protein [Nakamurella sp. PAMC28650]|uniref:hypothetical protein n=1 Tax=Nakamurella sp. PAMC28650 TaxID=2762325 RepID=UPI00164E7859|nr:hypothetical protein [Nakamurella sp. PAMC28650]QNK79431.1 hypothetical protein H7F38_14060 [Nakamurella sp. PAMC28650]
MTELGIRLRGGISRSTAPRRFPSLRRRPLRRPAAAVLALVLATSALTAIGGSTAASAAPSLSAAAPDPGFTSSGHPNPAADLSSCSTRAAGVLCVRAAQDSILPGAHNGGQGPGKNDPVPQFKWLLNKDNTGGVTLGADGRTPIAAEVTKCHPITSTFPNGNANYPNPVNTFDGTGPLLADGSPNPAACNWPSIHNITSSPVVSQGTQQDWNPTTPIPLQVGRAGRGLPNGKYLVSITSNGYQIGGGHFVVTDGKFSGLDTTPAGAVVVGLNPLPIPLSNIRLKVYGDMGATNAQWDEQSEFGLPGYDAHLTDFDGPVNVDYYNNPLCTAYRLNPDYDRVNHPDPTDSFYQVKLGLDARPIVDPAHHIRGNFEVAGPATGSCTSDSNGDILIPYMAPNRYGSSVIADQSSGTDPVTGQVMAPQQTCAVLSTKADAVTTATQAQACWVQTTTLEGNHDFDTWPQANSTGYDTELLVGGELVPQVQFGFVRAGCMANPATGTVDYQGLTDPTKWLSPADPACATVPQEPGAPAATGAIKGKIMGAAAYYPGLGGLTGANGQAGNAGTAGYKFDRPVKHPWVTLSDLNNGDKTVWASNANLDGSFQINGVPDGSYSVAVWDQMQDYIFDSFNVTVAGGKVVDLGVVPLLEWWTRITGHVCIDTNGNGRCDPGEAGVPHFLVQNLNRTNNAQEGGQNTDVTDQNGFYQFTEAYPLGYNDVIQAFNTRWKTTGMTWQACNDPQEHTTSTAAVDVQYNPVIAQCGRLDWAVQPYKGATTGPGDAAKTVKRSDNGGIVATVLYDAVRNRNLGRTQVQYDYFTGIPGVMTELFQPIRAAAGAPTTQSCPGGSTAPNVSFTGYLLNCDGSYHTATVTGGYSTAYKNGQVDSTDRFGAANPGTVNAYQSEHYGRATGCVARDANGKIISGSLGAGGKVTGTNSDGTTVTDFLPGLTVDPASPNPGHYTQACIEAPASAVNFGLGTDNLLLDPNVPTGATHGTQTVDGNFALTPTDASGAPVTGNFLAKVDIPGDKVLPQPTPGVDRPLYKVADETSNNNLAGSGLAPYTTDLGSTDTKNDGPGHASTPQFVPQNADLTNVYNQDGTLHTNLGASCPVLTAPGTTGTCVAFSFPSQAGPPSQTPIATPVTGGDSPTTQIEDPNTASPSADPQCAGSAYTVNVTDPGLLSAGGSMQQGNTRNSCDVHLIHVGGGQSVAPNFYLYTDVPIPTTFIVQNFDDTNLSTTKTETQYGDAAPIPNSPEGVYDWHGNLVDQMNIDPNGIAEALMPSTDVANCATPAGICQNIYRFVGNDPGTIDHPNFNYNPQFQTITANFQAMPGEFTPADTAPTRSALAFLNGGQKFTAAAQCAIAPTSPQLYSVDHPYGAPAAAVVIKGLGFGGTQGAGRVTLAGNGLTTPAVAGISSWSDTEIHASIPLGTPGGKYQLTITNDAKTATVNGISYYVIDGTYKPAILEVDPTLTAEATDQAGWTAQTKFPSIQEALERAAGYWLKPTAGNLVYTQVTDSQLPGAIVVVYPAAVTQQSPVNSAVTSGVWFEPVIIHSAVTLQGVGPGGVIPATAGNPATVVPGTVIDGRYYFGLTDNTVTPPAAIDWATAPQDVRAQHAVDIWQSIAGVLFPKTPGVDNKLITEGQNVTVLGQRDQPEYGPSAHPVLDGFGLQAAVTINTPANVNANTGQRTGPAGGADATQGGALFLNGHDDYTQVTNDVIDGNSGSYGAIRVGSPQLDAQHNWNVEFGNNQIVANGGNNLGGGMAIFNDAGGYNVHDNLICGNQSAEYGGGMSQYGLSIAPVTFTGTLSTDGKTLTWTGGGTAGPFTGADVGSSVAGDGLKGASIVSVQSPTSVTLSGVNDAGLFKAGFRYIPGTAARQTNVNVIAHNVVNLNQSQDEGGGIMIAGQLPADSTKPSLGAGPLNISGNTISVNAANDDGGGIRFLQAGNFPIRVENNSITNNVSSHEGGGIALDDTAQVTIINDTIAKNITTATAVTSNGSAAPAGISTAHNSDPFQATLPAGSPTWSNPIIANDIVYDNRAGSWNASTSNVSGIGQTGDATPLNVWDIGIADPGAGLLSPIHSVLSTSPGAAGGEGYTASPTNRVTAAPTVASANAPGFAAPFSLQLDITPMRINFRFRVTAIVNIGLPANSIGDYHIGATSPAVLLGANQLAPGDITAPFSGPIFAPTVDIDGVSRFDPQTTQPRIDAGATQAPR